MYCIKYNVYNIKLINYTIYSVKLSIHIDTQHIVCIIKQY